MRLIDADALIKEITEFRCVNCDRRKGMKKGKMTFVYEIGETPCRACDVMDTIDVLDEAPTIPYDMKWNDECEDCRPECIEDCIECRKRANQ